MRIVGLIRHGSTALVVWSPLERESTKARADQVERLGGRNQVVLHRILNPFCCMSIMLGMLGMLGILLQTL